MNGNPEPSINYWLIGKSNIISKFRFEKGDGSKGNCDLRYYCGGNYQGLINRLDYIKGYF